MRRRRSPALIPLLGLFLACMYAAGARGAQPVTITFEDLHNKPFGHDALPPFFWRGVQFSGGGLHRTDALGTWYEARNRSAMELRFPPGSTDISFDADGLGRTIYLPDRMPIQVWSGSVGSGTLIRTLPLAESYSALFPPKHKVTIAGPASVITLFSAPAPSGIREVYNTIYVDNIRYTPPDPEPSIAFDAVLPAHRRVLTHNYGDFPYPSPLQTQDGKIRVQATVLVNGQPAPGKTIHFRLIDPPDDASYVEQAGDEHFGDNFDGPGSLEGTGQPSATAASDGAGRVAVTLHVTSFAAGDNYQIEASGTPGFSCGASCAKSAVYTAWKRIYVEYNKMFRKGAFLTENVPAGAKKIPVDDVSDLPTPPFEIRLLHAARVDAPSGEFATEERAQIIAVNKEHQSGLLSWFSSGPRRGELLLDPSADVPGLQRAYSGPEVIGNNSRSYLADAVGVVTGDRAADFLLANGTLVNALFDQAFAEYVWLTDALASDADLLFTQPRLPYDGVLPFHPVVGGEDLDGWQREWLTRKWLRFAERQGIDRIAKANHQALFTTGSFWNNNSLQTPLGLTTVVGNFNDAWLAHNAIGSQIRMAEATVHELAHQWRVNHGGSNPGASGGHCGYVSNQTALRMRGHSGKYCTMTGDVFAYPEEARDGIVGFHYAKFGGVADSEFLRIRRRAEPVPQNEVPRKTPQ